MADNPMGQLAWIAEKYRDCKSQAPLVPYNLTKEGWAT